MHYSIKRLKECTEDDLISCDVSYTIPALTSMIMADKAGLINLEDECWFGYKENYRFAPADAPVIVKTES